MELRRGDGSFTVATLAQSFEGKTVVLATRAMDEDQPEKKRHVWVDHKGETSVRNLFAVGDMTKREDEPVMKQVYTAQEYAVRAVDGIDSRRGAGRLTFRSSFSENQFQPQPQGFELF